MPTIERYSSQARVPETAGTAQAPMSLAEQPDNYSGIGNLGKAIQQTGTSVGNMLIEIEQRKTKLKDSISSYKAEAMFKVAREEAKAEIEMTPDTSKHKAIADKHYQKALSNVNKLEFTEGTRNMLFPQIEGEQEVFQANIALAGIRKDAQEAEVVAGQAVISAVADFGGNLNMEKKDGNDTPSYRPEVAEQLAKYRDVMSLVYSPDIVEVKVNELIKQGDQKYRQNLKDEFGSLLSQSNYAGAEKLVNTAAISEEEKVMLMGDIQKQEIIGIARNGDYVKAKEELKQANIPESEKFTLDNHIDSLMVVDKEAKRKEEQKKLNDAYSKQYQIMSDIKDINSLKQFSIIGATQSIVDSGEDYTQALSWVTSVYNSKANVFNAETDAQKLRLQELKKAEAELNYANLNGWITQNYENLDNLDVIGACNALEITDKTEILLTNLKQYKEQGQHPLISNLTDMYKNNVFGESFSSEAGLRYSRAKDTLTKYLSTNPKQEELESFYRRLVTDDMYWGREFKILNEPITTYKDRKEITVRVGEKTVEEKVNGKTIVKKIGGFNMTGKYASGDTIVTPDGKHYILHEDTWGNYQSTEYIPSKNAAPILKENSLHQLGLTMIDGSIRRMTPKEIESLKKMESK